MKTKFAWVPSIALMVVLVGCNDSGSTSNNQVASVAPTTDTVKRQDLVGYSFFDGKLVVPATAQGTAYSPYDTPVISVSTAVGKYVSRGDPIVKLTIPGADEAAKIASASATSASTNYADEKSVASAPVKAAMQALSQAQAAEKTAQETVASGGTADVQAATQARVDAETALRDAQQKMKETLQPAKADAAMSAAELQAVKADAAKGIVRAPVSGTIVTMEAKPGLDAHAKQGLATIINFDAARVQGTVPTELKDIVVKNSKVIIAMNGQSSEPMDGKVIDVKVIPPAAGQQGPGYLAIIEFTNPRSMAQPSTTVKRVGVKTGSVKQALVVPVGAVTVKEGKSSVKVQNGTEWVETPVETGLSDGARIEIKSGLTEGAVVQVVSATSAPSRT